MLQLGLEKELALQSFDSLKLTVGLLLNTVYIQKWSVLWSHGVDEVCLACHSHPGQFTDLLCLFKTWHTVSGFKQARQCECSWFLRERHLQHWDSSSHFYITAYSLVQAAKNEELGLTLFHMEIWNPLLALATDVRSKIWKMAIATLIITFLKLCTGGVWNFNAFMLNIAS